MQRSSANVSNSSVSSGSRQALTGVYQHLETWHRQEVSTVLAKTSPGRERNKDLVKVLLQETQVLRKLGEAKRRQAMSGRQRRTENFLKKVRQAGAADHIDVNITIS